VPDRAAEQAEAGAEQELADGRVQAPALVGDQRTEEAADRVDQRALPDQDPVHPLGRADEGEQWPDDGRAGDHQHGAEHRRRLPADPQQRCDDQGRGEAWSPPCQSRPAAAPCGECGR
jgi:hypothetical protein